MSLVRRTLVTLALFSAPALSACGADSPGPTTAAPMPSPSATTTGATATPTVTTTAAPTGSSKAPVTAPPTQTAATVEPAPSRSAAAKLASLARNAPKAQSVTYDFTSTSSGQSGTMRIDMVPSGYRVSVRSDGQTQLLIVQRDGDTISCTNDKCLRVATDGAGVPGELDPQLQHVVTDYLAVFASQPDEISVAPGDGKVPGNCFAVTQSGTGPTTVDAGTYCLDNKGHVTFVSYPSGQLQLTTINGAPSARVLVPPSAPKPVPSSTVREPID